MERYYQSAAEVPPERPLKVHLQRLQTIMFDLIKFRKEFEPLYREYHGLHGEESQKEQLADLLIEAAKNGINSSEFCRFLTTDDRKFFEIFIEIACRVSNICTEVADALPPEKK